MKRERRLQRKEGREREDRAKKGLERIEAMF